MSKSPRRLARTWPSDFLCSELVQVLGKSRIDRRASAIAILEAISETEAVLSCELPMRRGLAVEVKTASWSFRARIAGCRKDADLRQHVVLVRFEDSFRWNAEAFCPEHMLDVRTIAGQDASRGRPEATAPRVFAAGQSFWQ